MSVNKVILVGNVGKDPETRYLDESTAISKFPLATSETYRNKSGERVSTTEWHNIVLWRGLAQVAEKYVRKGTQLYIEGRIKTRSYEDANGIRKYITEIVGDQMQLLGKRPDEGTGQGMQDNAQVGTQGGVSTPYSQTTGGGTAPAGGEAPAGGAAPTGGETPAGGAPAGGTAPESGPVDPFDGGSDGPDDLPF